MRAFLAVPGGWACELEPAELRIISRIVADTAELLGSHIEEEDDAEHASEEDAVLAALDWDPAAGQPPRDPALARLLPPASREDEQLAAELRRLTESSLRATKVDHLRVVHAGLRTSSGVVVVRAGQERAWLSALTDLRLVLAARLGIETDEDAERVYDRAGTEAPTTPRDELDAALTSLYAALTWWQESLLEAMSGGPR
ncbi:DUF2017 domain-containing protein [Georgenia sp. 311]|uniref:DUF2017 domain-containing protein n=1 Tax=Georgenia wutianyii TaxID=2585135 RepID=A0ABX5VJF8_9MICO|nr:MULTISPECIES: DUF2017 domain-containing protein [Georgenia]QDB78552.1 DUF2017 domain-containing protein [Georgenia wutianyii]TNC16844.1 DUF2017 domain-containing protein [Georgenia sp. 311]